MSVINTNITSLIGQQDLQSTSKSQGVSKSDDVRQDNRVRQDHVAKQNRNTDQVSVTAQTVKAGKQEGVNLGKEMSAAVNALSGAASNTQEVSRLIF